LLLNNGDLFGGSGERTRILEDPKFKRFKGDFFKTDDHWKTYNPLYVLRCWIRFVSQKSDFFSENSTGERPRILEEMKDFAIINNIIKYKRLRRRLLKKMLLGNNRFYFALLDRICFWRVWGISETRRKREDPLKILWALHSELIPAFTPSNAPCSHLHIRREISGGIGSMRGKSA
jgi:hypothetical protein